jgi:hypothetical protein
MINYQLRLLTLCILLITTLPDLLMAQLERRTADIDESVSLTFMAPRNINLYTVESLSKGELHYSILHTFGPVNSGARNLFGIDAGANVRFSFEYGITDRFSLGLGRSSLDKNIALSSRIALLRQNPAEGMPVSVSFVPSVGINTVDPDFLPGNYIPTDRINYGFSLPVARKFNDKLSLQLSPMLVHFNRVGPELNIMDPEVNTYYSVGFAGRYKIKPRMALSFQYIPPLTDAEDLNANLALGIDIETGGHVFQMFFTTSRALNDPYLIAGDNGDFFAREFRFGFNVNRLFQLN